MKVSAVICTWNHAGLLAQTLDRMRALRVPDGVEWELIVVNNACTDDTDHVLDTFAGCLPIRRLYEPRSGQSYARNLAMRESSADWLLWTDDDVLVNCHWMEALLRAAVRDQAHFVFGRSIPHWTAAPPDWFSPVHNGRFALLDYGETPFVITDADRGFFGLNFGTRRDSLLALGGCDESMGFSKAGGAAGEDTDLCRRALAAGLTIAYVPDAVVAHVIPPRRTTKDFYRDRVRAAATRDYQRVREQFAHVPWLAGLPRFMIRHAAADALGYLVRTATRERDRAFDYELKLRRFAGYCRAAASWTESHQQEHPA